MTRWFARLIYLVVAALVALHSYEAGIDFGIQSEKERQCRISFGTYQEDGGCFIDRLPEAKSLTEAP